MWSPSQLFDQLDHMSNGHFCLNSYTVYIKQTLYPKQHLYINKNNNINDAHTIYVVMEPPVKISFLSLNHIFGPIIYQPWFMIPEMWLSAGTLSPIHPFNDRKKLYLLQFYLKTIIKYYQQISCNILLKKIMSFHIKAWFQLANKITEINSK